MMVRFVLIRMGEGPWLCPRPCLKPDRGKGARITAGA